MPDETIGFSGYADLLEELAEFFNSHGIGAEVQYYIRASEPSKNPKRRGTDFLKVTGKIMDVAKRIIDFLDRKPTARLTLKTGKKTIEFTKKDSAGNVEKFFQENQGVYFDITIEL
jgi:hypothetical protein